MGKTIGKDWAAAKLIKNPKKDICILDINL